MVFKERKTSETAISLKLELAGEGRSAVETGIGFFDHMLQTLAKHALFDLELKCAGDLEVDFHHSVEDTGILLGQAIAEAAFPAIGIERFADRIAVLDEAAVSCAIDISGRSYLEWSVPIDGKIGEFDAELCGEFFRALVTNAKITAHFRLISGANRHHIIESAFKAFALAMRQALAQNPRVTGAPSAKGIL